MILAIIFTIIGLGAIASVLHRMTINALPLFAALTAAFAAHRAGVGLTEAILIAFAVGAMLFGLLDALMQPNIHPVIRLSARAIYVAPACAVAWFMNLACARMGQVCEMSATLLAALAVACIARTAWQSLSPTD